MAINYITPNEAFDFLSRALPEPKKDKAQPITTMVKDKAQPITMHAARERIHKMQTEKKVSIFFITTGILLIIGGMLICLDSYNLLSQAQKVITSVPGECIFGGVLISMGFIMTVVTSVMYHRRQQADHLNQINQFNDIAWTLRSVVPPLLEKNQILIMGTPESLTVEAFCSSKLNKHSNQITLHGTSPLPWTAQTFKDMFEKDHTTLEQELGTDLQFISLSTLDLKIQPK